MLNKLPKEIVNIIYCKLHLHALKDLHNEYRLRLKISDPLNIGKEMFYFDEKFVNWRCMEMSDVCNSIYLLSKNTKVTAYLPERYFYSTLKIDILFALEDKRCRY